MKEINISNWYDIATHSTNNSVAEQEIFEFAEKGELVVIDNDGNRFIPKRVSGIAESWQLEPEQ